MARLRGRTSTVTTGPGTIVTSTTAPPNPVVGQLWYKPETAVTYQYTSDGATNFWLDISSDGIGTSATKSIDWAGNTDPLMNHSATLSGLAIGDVYYNREGNRYFVCQNVTTNKNKWSGRYVGLGGIQQTYISGTTTYMSHTFLESGTFYLDATQSCDILIVAGGGGGGGTGNDDTCGGGGGGGGVRELSSQSVAAGAHAVTVGFGGNGGAQLQGHDIENGEDSSFTATYVAKGGGYGGSYSNANGAGAAGGTGVVLIRYLTLGSVTDMSLVSNAQTAQAAPSNSRVCMLMDPATGTTTVNTDVKAYVSRDNGTTYSQITLADEGTYSGTQKILAGTVDVSGQPSGTSMRYKIETLNQSSGSKITRIYGTSLSWL